jgi:predicted ArsR family transcriptional regulator
MASEIEQEDIGGGVRPIDHAVLDLLRRHPGMTVPELISRLSVTATAVRQRLDRLVEMKLVERRKQAIGRGRPTFLHFLTSLGWREVGATYADLALAMWREVKQLPESEFKQQFFRNVSERLGRVYEEQLPAGPLATRMESLVDLLVERKIAAKVGQLESLPVLEVQACPYPELADGSDDRRMCEMEKEVLTAALGQDMELSMCRLDGHDCCQFRPVQNNSTSR